ncbi:MAG: hypothetical protein EZS28_028932, partial [Streblomastix strix]
KQQVQQDCYTEYANWFRLARAVVKEMEIMRDDGEDNEAIMLNKNKLGYKISVDTVARSIALGLLKMLGEQNPLFKGRSQQDSHEALLSILDALHEVSTDKGYQIYI